jgi:LacI family transcriptional regulator
VDGFIIVPAEHGEKQIEELVREKIPVVLLDRYFKGIDVSCVGVNNYQAAMEVTNLLLNLNCKRIVHMTYKHNISPMQERMEGYVAALTKKGLYDPKLIKKVDFWTMSTDTPAAVMELLSSDEKIDGFFFASSSIALHAVKKFAELKLEIPKDIKAVCFSKNDIFELPNISIPYIQQPIPEIGKRAVELIIEHITKKDAPNFHEILQTKLIF